MPARLIISTLQAPKPALPFHHPQHPPQLPTTHDRSPRPSHWLQAPRGVARSPSRVGLGHVSPAFTDPVAPLKPSLLAHSEYPTLMPKLQVPIDRQSGTAHAKAARHRPTGGTQHSAQHQGVWRVPAAGKPPKVEAREGLEETSPSLPFLIQSEGNQPRLCHLPVSSTSSLATQAALEP